MAVVPWLDLEAAATALGFDVDAASVPHVQPPSGTNPLLELFRGLDSRTPLRRSRRAKIDPDLMLDAVARIACQRPPPAPRRRARWDSRDLVEETGLA